MFRGEVGQGQVRAAIDRVYLTEEAGGVSDVAVVQLEYVHRDSPLGEPK